MIRFTHELENGDLMVREFDTYEEFVAVVNSGELEGQNDTVREDSEVHG